MNEESNMQALAAQHLDYSKKIGGGVSKLQTKSEVLGFFVVEPFPKGSLKK